MKEPKAISEPSKPIEPTPPPQFQVLKLETASPSKIELRKTPTKVEAKPIEVRKPMTPPPPKVTSHAKFIMG